MITLFRLAFVLMGLALSATAWAIPCETAQTQAAGRLCEQSFRCESRFVKGKASPAATDRRAVCLANAGAVFVRGYKSAAAKPPACTSGADPGALASTWADRLTGAGGIVTQLRNGWDANNPTSNQFYAELLAGTASACHRILKSGGTSAVARAKFVQAANKSIRKARRRGLNYPVGDPGVIADGLATLAGVPIGLGTIPPVATPQSPNPGLTGRLFINGGDIDVLELATGAKIAIRGISGEPGVSWDGSELANFNIDSSKIVVFGADGLTRTEFDRSNDNDPEGPVEFSPDGQKLVFIEARFVPATVTVISRTDGRVLARFVDESNELNSYAWLPDGRLALARGKQILLTDGNLGNAAPIITLPDKIDALDVSRDGSRFVFRFNEHIWTVNADGSALTQRTISSASEFSPTFSPDGRFIAFMYDPRFGAGSLWVVPADGVRVGVGRQYLVGAQPLKYVDDKGELRSAVGLRGLSWR